MDGVYVGVDDSKDAARALAWALQYAARGKLPLTVVTVVDPRTLMALWTDRPDEETKQARMAAARQGVEELIADVGKQSGLGADVAVTIQILFGHPVKELVDAAADAELLVVGSRGESGFGRLLLGSVSSGVVHHAHCTVTVVKP
jgi:nucleotide-binding universal stress UspA family protein